MWCLSIVFLLASVLSAAADQDAKITDQLSFTLPDGYIHKPGRGVDTSPGDIYAKASEFEIHYDVGTQSGAAKRIKKWKEQEIALKKIPLEDGLGEGYLRIVKGKSTWVAFASTNNIFFEAELKQDGDLEDFTAIISSLRRVQPKPAPKPKAEQAKAQNPGNR